MRFRTTIESPSTFYKIIQAVEKLQKRCIIRFTPTNIHIICNSEANEGGMQVWSQIKVDAIFTEYRIQSNSNNEITVAVTAEAFAAALKSASGSAINASSSHETDEVVMKLAKKNDNAVLSFEIIATTGGGKRVNVTHDVRIDVMKPVDVDRLSEPMCPEPDTHILLPPLQKLRAIVDKLKPMSDILSVKANNNGVFQLSINTESVKVETEWQNLTNPKMVREGASQEDPDNSPPDPNDVFGVLVATRSFVKFLNSHVISTTTIACICQKHCLILYVYIGDVAEAGGVLTFYLPAVIDDED
ncbi:checkpoint clamp complex protein hus1 [Moniliophthora roreri MCA 2997]|uniref:Checkpoint protein n=2 Tax=Moniliophthora roreri TaxID=221103 RepID=V2WG45_MONRO|nr:checkpoint clamp complex protein hus1 [Moniliophthora roreri MCA 2997]KAI3605682.1 checkpoint clamp complex protein hus1 [Moniliophthora roreri]